MNTESRKTWLNLNTGALCQVDLPLPGPVPGSAAAVRTAAHAPTVGPQALILQAESRPQTQRIASALACLAATWRTVTSICFCFVQLKTHSGWEKNYAEWFSQNNVRQINSLLPMGQKSTTGENNGYTENLGRKAGFLWKIRVFKKISVSSENVESYA